MYGGKFKDCARSARIVAQEFWNEIEAYLKTGNAQGWSLACHRRRTVRTMPMKPIRDGIGFCDVCYNATAVWLPRN